MTEVFIDPELVDDQNYVAYQRLCKKGEFTHIQDCYVVIQLGQYLGYRPTLEAAIKLMKPGADAFVHRPADDSVVLDVPTPLSFE